MVDKLNVERQTQITSQQRSYVRYAKSSNFDSPAVAIWSYKAAKLCRRMISSDARRNYKKIHPDDQANLHLYQSEANHSSPRSYENKKCLPLNETPAATAMS
jgi:hypothetical protein